jgi:hypothetical protein
LSFQEKIKIKRPFGKISSKSYFIFQRKKEAPLHNVGLAQSENKKMGATTLSIKTFSINDTQHNSTSTNTIMLSAIMLNVAFYLLL